MPKIIIEDTRKKNLRDSLNKILDTYITSFSGKKVIVKPNILGPFRPEKGVTTHPELVSVLVDLLLERDARVIVGDNPGSIYSKIEEIGKVTGLGPASKGHLESISLNPVWMKIDSIGEKVPISREILDADIVINLPRFKTHGLTGITCSIKNMFGIIPGGKKAYLHTVAPNRRDFSKLLVDIYAIRPPEITIVDGITAMEGAGPSNGHIRNLYKIIGGEDGVAIDSIVSNMMGIKPTLIDTTLIAHERGLGELDLKKIIIDGNLEIIPNFRMPSRIMNFLPEKLNKLFNFGLLKPKLLKQKCIKCGNCEEVCPQNAIKLTPYPDITREKCISCYSCIEHCPTGALTLPTVVEDVFANLKYKLRKKN